MIRQCSPEDRELIRELLNSAFSPSRYESALREIVVDHDEPCLEWVFVEGDEVVAYILYTPATRGAAEIGYHLAPVAVHPAYQHQGIGSRLIRESLAMLNDEPVFVLGDPGYYERFGFTSTTTALCPFDDGNRHFRAMRWDDDGEPFSIGYSSAFEKAEQATSSDQ